MLRLVIHDPQSPKCRQDYSAYSAYESMGKISEEKVNEKDQE